MGVLNDDLQLMRQFVESHSETAFATLVRRHSALVFGTALRCLNGRTALAEDVAQQVFIDLARKAASLPQKDLVLGAWLHRHTRFLSATARRTEVRRLSREWTAHAMNETPDTTTAAAAETLLEMLGPDLDEALDELGDADREALVLRFLEKCDLRTVGQRLGLSDDAAQKRVSRALDRLRDLLARRGYTVPSVALGAILTRAALVDVPAALATTAAAASIAGTVSSSTIPVGSGIGSLLLMNKSKILALGAAALALGVATPLLLKPTTPKMLESRSNSAMRSRTGFGDPPDAGARHFEYTNRSKEPEKLTQWRRDRLDQLRQAKEIKANSSSTNAIWIDHGAWNTNGPQLRLKSRYKMDSGDTLLTRSVEYEPGRIEFALITPTILPDNSIRIITRIVALPSAAARDLPIPGSQITYGVLDTSEISGSSVTFEAENAKLFLKDLEMKQGVDFLSSPTLITSDNLGGQISVGTELQLSYTPTIQPGGKAIWLDMDLKLEARSMEGAKRPK